MPVSFEIQVENVKLQNKVLLKKWIRRIIGTEKKTCGTISFVLTDDESLIDVNRKFLDHDTYTDIITFDYTEGQRVGGDIIISVDRVRENSKKFGVQFENELHRVMIHGVLHLCGYRDKTKSEKSEMRAMENSALSTLESLS